MVILPEDKNVKQLHDVQDAILMRLFPLLTKHSNIWLSGGTALAREWLHHRVSFDLDFKED